MKKIDKKYTSRLMILIFADVLTLFLSYMTALMARFDFVYNNIPEVYTDAILRFIPAAIVIYMVVYWRLKLYHSIWRYASAKEVQRIIIAYILIAGLLILLDLIPVFNIPRSVLFYGYVLSLLFCIAIRFGYRLMRTWMIDANNKGISQERTMIIGAGYAAVSLLRNQRFMNHYRVVAIIDDNPSTWGKLLEGVKIEGGREKIRECADKYHVNTIVFAIPSAPREEKGEIIRICKDTGCKLQTVPGMGGWETAKLSNISIGDMLGRSLVDPNRQFIDNLLRDRTVMITGAAGTVGSVLALRIAEALPRELILIDLNEAGLYELKRKITKRAAGIRCTVIYGNVGSLTPEETGTADYVFHAASVMRADDRNCDRAVRNNREALQGALRLARGAEKLVVLLWPEDDCQVEKAAKSVHAAGSAAAGKETGISREEGTQSGSAAGMQQTGTEQGSGEDHLLLVRMGYVLGTGQDIVRMFQHEIDEGGPVTVPDPNMVRSYITPEEAAEFTLMATFDPKGERDVTIDQGVPVRVDELARDLIKLNGYKEDEIRIVYTGKAEGYR